MYDMKPHADIIKVGAIILDGEGKILIVKPRGKDIWLFVGGKIEDGETHEQCLHREVREELNVNIVGTPEFYSKSPVEPAANDVLGRTVQIFEYLIDIEGEPKPSHEIESVHWLSKNEFLGNEFPLGSVLQHHAIPSLMADGKIWAN